MMLFHVRCLLKNVVLDANDGSQRRMCVRGRSLGRARRPGSQLRHLRAASGRAARWTALSRCTLAHERRRDEAAQLRVVQLSQTHLVRAGYNRLYRIVQMQRLAALGQTGPLCMCGPFSSLLLLSL